MNKRSLDILAMLAIIVAFAVLFCGWLYNIAMLFTADESVGFVMFRILGVVFPPLGALTGVIGWLF